MLGFVVGTFAVAAASAAAAASAFSRGNSIILGRSSCSTGAAFSHLLNNL